MHTSTEAVNLLHESLASARAAIGAIEGLIVEHDYQDVAALVAQGAVALLESASLLMQSKDDAALAALERADDLLDAVYDIIDSETDDV